MAAGYEGKDIDGFEAAIDENLVEWIQYLQKHGLSYPGMTRKFDIARSIQHDDCYGFQETLEERLPIVEKLAVITELNTILKIISFIPLLRRILPSAQDQYGIGKILGLAQKAVAKRFEPQSKPRNDILGSWLSKGVPRDQAESEMVIALFAGSDTTATSIRATLLYIISNPLIYARLQAEIDAAVATGSISSMVRNGEARKLLYLQACIKEGIRIFPPITALRERVTPPEGDTIRGHYIPGGVNIGLNMRGLLLNEVFGPDPEVFRPERWLDSDPDKLQDMERVHELVFNWGYTRCLGIHLATTMISKFFVEVSSVFTREPSCIQV
ncbi:MAG: hypothetical protein M1816_001612 [Peltula sp. TS41687]|nr:MAG: hypothetical protein M1816_001612 [Peltula sp. TS41687]